MGAWAAVVASWGTASVTGCDAIWGLNDRSLLPDAAADSRATDGRAEAGVPCMFGSSGLATLSDTACWETFDVSKVGSGPPGFYGATFDGRFVYLASSQGGTVLRYDTTLAFADREAWSSFDAESAFHLPLPFAGAIFDGVGVVFIPAKSSTFVRYDTRSGFLDDSAWSHFDPNATNPLVTNAAGYAGGTFDGTNLYFVPNTSTWGLAFDTHAAFSDAPAWEGHHIVAFGLDAGPDFSGATFDGRYVYMAPASLMPDSLGFLLRYDTKADDFTDEDAITTFDMTTVNSSISSFTDAAFDGRYVYFAPSGQSGSPVVTRFDSAGMLSDTGSWASFDMSRVSPSANTFFGVAFDGRFVYFPPWGTTSTGDNGLLVRYDTTAAFEKTSSWSTFDTNAIHAAAFQGSAFDGHFVYFASQSGSVIARFAARSTPKAPSPPLFPPSFF
jgi:hypothetical protein